MIKICSRLIGNVRSGFSSRDAGGGLLGESRARHRCGLTNCESGKLGEELGFFPFRIVYADLFRAKTGWPLAQLSVVA
jgi:hypothetical protein